MNRSSAYDLFFTGGVRAIISKGWSARMAKHNDDEEVVFPSECYPVRSRVFWTGGARPAADFFSFSLFFKIFKIFKFFFARSTKYRTSGCLFGTLLSHPGID